MYKPKSAKHCSETTCNQIDFLPFECKNCRQVFCLDHFKFETHGCSVDITQWNTCPQCPLCQKFIHVKATDNADRVVNRHISSGCTSDIVQSKDLSHLKCSMRSCKNVQKYECVRCTDCQKMHCLRHRHATDHKCGHKLATDSKTKTKPSTTYHTKKNTVVIDANGNTSTTKKINSAATSLLAKLRAKFAQEDESKTKKKKSKAALTKTKVNRLKAVGDERVSQGDRFYLEVTYPKNTVSRKTRTKAMFFKRTWTIGKVIDWICDWADLQNDNNRVDSKKLHLRCKRTSAEAPWDVPLHLLEPAIRPGDLVQLVYV